MVRLAVLTVLVALAAPASARAADVSVSNGVLRYTAAPGKVSNARFTETAAQTVVINRDSADDDALVAGAGCVLAVAPDTFATCSGVTSAAIDAGDQADRITASYRNMANQVVGLENIPAVIFGGDGSDAIVGSLLGDTIDGGPGNDDLDGSAGNDTMRGGDGNDTLSPNTGTDAVSGGDGIDTAEYGLRPAPTYTLDGQPNDGEPTAVPPENDLLGADVENITAASTTGVATLVGDTRANRLTVTAGRGDITGGDGADILEGGPADDVIHARDGSPDIIICNGGTDTVEADTLDAVSPSCEAVSTVATPGGAFDDRPPAIAWVSPGANASLSANSPSRFTVNASDDRAVTKVQFYDDDRLLCEVTAPPFDCAYVPRGSDVGRNTLIAVAFDGAGQTTSTIRVVDVRRFTSPGFGLALRPSRDREAPYAYRATGRLLRPTTVSPSQGCSGTVTISAKRGSKTVATHRTKLNRNCEYATTLKYRKRLASKLRLTAKFGGNDVLGVRTARSRTVRLG
jgi:Ca2+-binding RTX toxin-like protein